MATLTVPRTSLILSDVEVSRAPFPYFVKLGCLSPSLAEILLDWFESDAPWRLVEADFYDQYEFSLLHVALPEHVRMLVDDAVVAQLRADMSRLFGCALLSRYMAVAHKLVDGQRIAIHNDYLTGEESHRLVIQLNRGLFDANGGFFILFNSFEANDIHRILRPISASAIGFEIGPGSFHAVSRMHNAERYTIVYSFYRCLNEST